jgi:hypothetical protein
MCFSFFSRFLASFFLSFPAKEQKKRKEAQKVFKRREKQVCDE